MANILLVEDNELNRDMLSRRLNRKGFEVAIAIDGDECMNYLSSNLPDLILMDVSLPGRDGHQLTREIKADDRTKHIPVIALTAHAMNGDRIKALEAGCDEYDTKPVDLKRLLTKMNTLLEI
ncbi:MAG: two-component system cell cycle response regulator DivK [Enterobacterales bacterium]|jgi:two-component system cell cycle response regulator DivK